MMLRTLVLISLVDSEYSFLLCNPQVLSLRAEASSRANVDINDSVADIDNLTPPLPTPTLAISTPSISPAHVQDQDLRWNSSSPQMPRMLHQAADGDPAALPCLVILQQARQHPHLASIRTIPTQYRRVIVTAEDVREIAVHRHPFQTKSLSMGSPVCD